MGVLFWSKASYDYSWAVGRVEYQIPKRVWRYVTLLLLLTLLLLATEPIVDEEKTITLYHVIFYM